MENENYLNKSFILPCGSEVKNRLVKAAMTERISDHSFNPTIYHHDLYKKWSETGAGILITGNVLVDRKHLESAGNIVFDNENIIPKLKQWVNAGTKNGNHLWTQISHAGRQTNRLTNAHPLAPSAVKLNKIGLFGRPRAMTETDIRNVINSFVKAAIISKEAGFTGIQIHSAHGYLLSQFLSPRTNLRQDKWGGSIENRARLLLTIIQKCRRELGPEFPISVKLNSSDFQKDGFSETESLEVIRMLDEIKIDLLEISGGTYEKVAFFLMNEDTKESTKKREAYFLEFAEKVGTISSIPLMITGGFRTFNACNAALKNNELDFIGMGRPFITNLEDIPGFIQGEKTMMEDLVIRAGIQSLDDAAEGGYYAKSLIQIAKGKSIQTKPNGFLSSNFLLWHEFKKTIQNKLKIG